MVAYGESLSKAQRPGWEPAYIEYESLRSLLEEVERLYETSEREQEAQYQSLQNKKSATFEDTEQEALLVIEEGQGRGQGLELGGLGVGHNNQHLNLHSNNGDDDTLGKAMEHSEHFLRALRKQVEKVSLFALSRQGELADAVGSLRFNPYLTNNGSDGDLSTLSKDSSLVGKPQKLTIRHDSKGRNMGGISSGSGNYGSISASSTNLDRTLKLSDSSIHSEGEDSKENQSLYLDELSFLLPQMSRLKTVSKHGHGDNSSLQFRESLDTAPRPMFTGKAVLQRKNSRSNWNQNSYGNYLKTSTSNVSTESTSASASPNPSPRERGWSDEGEDDGVATPLLDPYTLIGVELLHLLRFICINAMGVRKILKKYDKIIERYAIDSEFNDEKLREDLNTMSPFVSSFSFNADQGPDVHLQQLTNSESIAAITLSLLKSSIKAGSMNILSMEQYMVQDETLLRFKCAIDCIDILREYANVVNQPFPAFLSRQAMIVTGYDLGGIEGMKQKALEVLLTFDPDTILHMDKLDLSEWQQRCWSYTFTSAGNKMRKTSFDLIDDEKNTTLEDRKLSWGGVDATTMIINLMSIFLYTVNYYIVAPTAHKYAHHLGAKRALGSTLIGASSFAALFSALLYSFWYSKLSYKSAFIFSSLCPIIGNALYVVALSKRSFRLALVGRVLVGFGSAEVLNRQLISSCVHVNYMTKASVAFVVAGALGMSIGPLFAGVLDKYAGRDYEIDFDLPYIGGIIFDHVSSPGFLMGGLWVIQLLVIIFTFKEPFRINGITERKQKREKKTFTSSVKESAGLIVRNPALPLTLFLFAYIEMICEVLISSCAMICSTYLNWSGSVAGLLIACLGALVLPAHFVVERTSRSFDERQIMKFSLIFITVSLLGVVNYEQVDHDVRVGSIYVRDNSIKTWHTVKDTSIRDWDTVKDPQTWKDLWNETEKDWQNFENMTEEEWHVFQNATVQEWEKLEKEGEEGWHKLGAETKEKYAEFANATQEEWVEIRKNVKHEWIQVVNETEKDWEALGDATKKEWQQLSNQTEEEWSKLNQGAREEWKNLGNQTASGWEKLRDGSETTWHNIEHVSSEKYHQTKDALSKASDSAAKGSVQLRNTTFEALNEWGSGLSDTIGGLANETSKVLHNANENTHKMFQRNENGGRLLLQKKKSLQPYDYGWGYYVYLIGISCIFMGVIVLEGVDTSLMCKAAPSKLNSTFINVGLLATMIGAIGRVLGNGLITLSALMPIEYADFVNCIFIPLIPITICGLYYVNRHYSALI